MSHKYEQANVAWTFVRARIGNFLQWTEKAEEIIAADDAKWDKEEEQPWLGYSSSVAREMITKYLRYPLGIAPLNDNDTSDGSSDEMIESVIPTGSLFLEKMRSRGSSSSDVVMTNVLSQPQMEVRESDPDSSRDSSPVVVMTEDVTLPCVPSRPPRAYQGARSDTSSSGSSDVVMMEETASADASSQQQGEERVIESGSDRGTSPEIVMAENIDTGESQKKIGSARSNLSDVDMTEAGYPEADVAKADIPKVNAGAGVSGAGVPSQPQANVPSQHEGQEEAVQQATESAAPPDATKTRSAASSPEAKDDTSHTSKDRPDEAQKNEPVDCPVNGASSRSSSSRSGSRRRKAAKLVSNIKAKAHARIGKYSFSKLQTRAKRRMPFARKDSEEDEDPETSSQPREDPDMPGHSGESSSDNGEERADEPKGHAKKDSVHDEGIGKDVHVEPDPPGASSKEKGKEKEDQPMPDTVIRKERDLEVEIKKDVKAEPFPSGASSKDKGKDQADPPMPDTRKVKAPKAGIGKEVDVKPVSSSTSTKEKEKERADELMLDSMKQSNPQANIEPVSSSVSSREKGKGRADKPMPDTRKESSPKAAVEEEVHAGHDSFDASLQKLLEGKPDQPMLDPIREDSLYEVAMAGNQYVEPGPSYMQPKWQGTEKMCQSIPHTTKGTIFDVGTTEAMKPKPILRRKKGKDRADQPMKREKRISFAPDAKVEDDGRPVAMFCRWHSTYTPGAYTGDFEDTSNFYNPLYALSQFKVIVRDPRSDDDDDDDDNNDDIALEEDETESYSEAKSLRSQKRRRNSSGSSMRLAKLPPEEEAEHKERAVQHYERLAEMTTPDYIVDEVQHKDTIFCVPEADGLMHEDSYILGCTQPGTVEERLTTEYVWAASSEDVGAEIGFIAAGR